MAKRKPWLTSTGRAPAGRMSRYLDDVAWYDQTGRAWDPSQMETRHLVNTVRMIRRTAVGIVLGIANREEWIAASIPDQDCEPENDDLHQLARATQLAGARFREKPTGKKRRAEHRAVEERVIRYVMTRPLVQRMNEEILRRVLNGDPTIDIYDRDPIGRIEPVEWADIHPSDGDFEARSFEDANDNFNRWYEANTTIASRSDLP